MSPWNAAGPPLCSPYLSLSHAPKPPCLVYAVVYVVYAVVYCIRYIVYNPHHLFTVARHSCTWHAYQIGPHDIRSLGSGILLHSLRVR